MDRNKRSLIHTLIKFKLGGIFTRIPLCILLIIFCFLLFLYSNGNLTPFSISVSSYYRTDWTFVNSYNRRPPGSVKHDNPFLILSILSIIGIFIGFILIIYIIIKYIRSTDYDLLPELYYSSKLPNKPNNVNMPNHHEKVIRKCRCSICNEYIYDKYWYFWSQKRYYNKSHICTSCRDMLISKKKEYKRLLKEYSKELNVILEERRLKFALHYERYYKMKLSDEEIKKIDIKYLH